MDNIIHFNWRAFVCKRQDNAQLGPLKKAIPTPYTAACRKKCKGNAGTAWTKSLDTGYCYYVQTTTQQYTNAKTYCGETGVNYISNAKLAHVKSQMENAGIMNRQKIHTIFQ